MSNKNEIITRDGVSCKVSDALTLNWDRVLLARVSAKKTPGLYALGESLQGVLNALKENPLNFAISHSECEMAKKLSTAVESVKLGGEDQPPIFVPLPLALARWEEAKKPVEKTGPSDEELHNATLEKAKANALERAEKLRKERKEIEAQVAELNALLPKSESFLLAESKKEQTLQLMEGFVLGHGVVDDERRPTTLRLNGESIPLLSYYELGDLIDNNGQVAEHLRVPCAFCGAEHELGETIVLTRKSKDGQERSALYMCRQVLLPAMFRGEDGIEQDLIFTRGPREGQLRKVSVAVCRNCGSTAHQTTQTLHESRVVWPVDTYPKFASWYAKRQEMVSGAAMAQERDGSRLRVSVGDRRQNAKNWRK